MADPNPVVNLEKTWPVPMADLGEFAFGVVDLTTGVLVCPPVGQYGTAVRIASEAAATGDEIGIYILYTKIRRKDSA